LALIQDQVMMINKDNSKIAFIGKENPLCNKLGAMVTSAVLVASL
jgi:hypothetical protein